MCRRRRNGPGCSRVLGVGVPRRSGAWTDRWWTCRGLGFRPGPARAKRRTRCRADASGAVRGAGNLRAATAASSTVRAGWPPRSATAASGRDCNEEPSRCAGANGAKGGWAGPSRGARRGQSSRSSHAAEAAARPGPAHAGGASTSIVRGGETSHARGMAPCDRSILVAAGARADDARGASATSAARSVAGGRDESGRAVDAARGADAVDGAKSEFAERGWGGTHHDRCFAAGAKPDHAEARRHPVVGFDAVRFRVRNVADAVEVCRLSVRDRIRRAFSARFAVPAQLASGARCTLDQFQEEEWSEEEHLSTTRDVDVPGGFVTESRPASTR